MLVIRRRDGESILIGEEIEVKVTEIGSTRVKLCITAPKDVPVVRKEVRLTRDANLAAATAISCLARVAGQCQHKIIQGHSKRTDMTRES